MPPLKACSNYRSRETPTHGGARHHRLLCPRRTSSSLLSYLEQYRIERLFARADDGTPPLDVIVVSLALVGVAGGAFWLAVLAQFAGPVVDGGVPPQVRAGVTYVAVGVFLLAVATAFFQRRPIGWLGAGAIALALLVWAVIAGIVTIPALVAVYCSLLVCGYLLARRRLFHPRE
ncbi:hypothetical protein AB7C87_02660 [Natrarchaeobius sp. A-rgal3]|uniref:hypothetical protein n=1 Tax=Natrarchaeobius versutus TaxID=1679078 RepID=UPI00350F1256